MERFVFSRKAKRWLSWSCPTLCGIAVYFFGAPFVIIVVIPLAVGLAMTEAQDWYRKHRGHP